MFRPRAHSLTEFSSGNSENRIPSSQFPVPAIFSRLVPLSPSPELVEVQKGTTFFPVKSLFLIKLLTTQEASRHQIG